MILDNTPPPGARPWAPAERATLRELWSSATDAELLAALPGRSLGGCIHQASQRFGLTQKQRPANLTGRSGQAWREQPDPPIGSRFRISKPNSLLPRGDWRVVAYQAGGKRVICEPEDRPIVHIMMTTEDLKRSIYVTGVQRLPDVDEGAVSDE